MIEFVKSVAVRAGKLALYEQSCMNSSNIHRKDTDKDLVTDADRKVEQFIISELKKCYPDFDVLGEESGMSANKSESTIIPARKSLSDTPPSISERVELSPNRDELPIKPSAKSSANTIYSSTLDASSI